MKLHQTSKTKNLQGLSVKSRDSMIKYNNGDYKLWTDEDLIQLMNSLHEFEIFKKHWGNLEGIQKADIGRYMFIYKHGGLYADTDVVFLRNISDYNTDKNILFAPSIPILPINDNSATNYVIYSKIPKHPFFLDLFKEVDPEDAAAFCLMLADAAAAACRALVAWRDVST